MTRVLPGFLAVALVAALSLIVVTRSDGAFGRPANINVTATLLRGQTRELSPTGRLADHVEQAWRINDRKGRRIGRMLISCRWILTNARFCNADIELPRGQIIASGASPTRFQGEYAVTGGTGSYVGGSGTMQFTAIGIGKNILLISITT